MIYLLYGSDTDKARGKLHDLVGSLLKKKPDASHEKMTDETFDEAHLDELISASGLFGSKAIVEIHHVFRNKDAKPVLLERLKDIAASENIFVILESTLTKVEVTKFEKHAEKIQAFESKEEKAPIKDFNIFSLTEALGKRDKKQLWVLYTKAKLKDISDEEIHGILFWQIKAMRAAVLVDNAKDAGLNPFVYQKSKGFIKYFASDELQKVSSKLVEIYHNARRGITEFDIGLEKFILEM